MDDLERYGDYNEYEDDDLGGRKSLVGLILKIVIIGLCAIVAGVIGFRVFLFNYYPDSMKRLYFTESLSEYYTLSNGEINAEKQSIRIKYDDADEGNFFADNLIVVREAGELQVSVRYNDSLFANFEEKYKQKIDPDSENLFTFTLERNPVDEKSKPVEIGTLAYESADSLLMYNYRKLAFTNVDFGEGDDAVSWIRLRITVRGLDTEDEFLIPIYESYYPFEEYKLSDSEVPK